MDNVTHTLFALTLARTRLGRGGRGSTTALVLASNAPDIDIVATLGGSANYLAWHRGPTHGPLGVIGLAVLTATIVWGGGKLLRSWGPPSGRPIPLKRDPTFSPDAPFGSLLVASLVGVMCHILMDLPTSYGTRLLSPFSSRWYAIDLLPIIDIYLLIALVAGLVVGRRSAAAGRRWAGIVFVLMAINYGGRAVAHHQALDLTERLVGTAGATLPPACDQQPSRSLVVVWPRTLVSRGAGEPCALDIAALPTFFSPFQWRVVRRLPGDYWVDDVDILERRAPAAGRADELGVTIANRWTPAVVEAAKTRTAQIFLAFSRFPDASASVDAGHVTTVRFTDMRFAVIDPARDVRRAAPFTLTVKIGPNHEILQERLGP
jgi:inner membrane protein